MTGDRGRTLRLDELRLLIPVALLATIGLWMVALSDGRSVVLAWSDLRLGLTLGAGLLAASTIWTITRFRGDQLLLPLVATLAVLGFIMLNRLQPDLTRMDADQWGQTLDQRRSGPSPTVRNHQDWPRAFPRLVSR